jgi:hypothetical protein
MRVGLDAVELGRILGRLTETKHYYRNLAWPNTPHFLTTNCHAGSWHKSRYGIAPTLG